MVGAPDGLRTAFFAVGAAAALRAGVRFAGVRLAGAFLAGAFLALLATDLVFFGFAPRWPPPFQSKAAF